MKSALVDPELAKIRSDHKFVSEDIKQKNHTALSQELKTGRVK